MGDKDDIYLTIQIKRSDVEARFAETGTPSTDRSMEIIGDCLRETPVEQLKEAILTQLLLAMRTSIRATLKERNEK